MLTRRDFLKTGSISAPLISTMGTAPMFLPATLLGHEQHTANDRILVVVELDGGNDGINTIVPFRDDGYARHRTALRLPSDRLIRITDNLGVHPSLRKLTDCYHAGQLAIVQGVGYPNPSRSHFRSMDIWHSAIGPEQPQTGLGWIGRALDEKTDNANVVAMSLGARATPLALRGRRCVASSIQSVKQFSLSGASSSLVENRPTSDSDSSALQFARRTQVTALETLRQLRESSKNRGKVASREYPSGKLSEQLSLVANLIGAELPCRVYYVRQSGYDTHAGQLPTHARLLRQLSEGLAAFQGDLQRSGLADRVTVITFSEFGRRVRENSGEGTDHGTAGPVLLLGNNVAGGIHGRTPDLSDTVNGDLKMSVDFRSVYASILGKWLKVNSHRALEAEFPTIPLFKRLS